MNIVAEAFDETDQPMTVEGDFQAMVKEFADLENQKRKCAGELDGIESRLKELEPLILEGFAAIGCQNMKVNGITLYKKIDFYVSKKGEVPTPELIEMLRRHGLGHLVAEGYSSSALKSQIKEWRDEAMDVPEELAQRLNIGETVRLASRKA